MNFSSYFAEKPKTSSLNNFWIHLGEKPVYWKSDLLIKRKFRWKATCYGSNINTSLVRVLRPETVAGEAPASMTITFLDSEPPKDFNLMTLSLLDDLGRELERWIYNVEIKNISKDSVKMDTNLLKYEYAK